MKKAKAAIAAAIVVGAFALGGSAHAACIVDKAAEGKNHSKETRLDTMTADAVELKGGCMDGVAIGQNNPAPGNFSTLTVNGNPVSGALAQLPTSCDGQPAGTVYNNGGTVAICTTVSGPGALLASDNNALLISGSTTDVLLVR